MELTEKEVKQLEKVLEDLGMEHDATIQLAEVFGKRWHYLAGKTDSEAGLLGMIRADLGNGFGVIIFPHTGALSEPAKSAICDAVRRGLA